MKTFLLSIIAGISTLAANAQSNNADKQAVEKQVDAFLGSWNKHDFTDMHEYTTEDVDWVNIVGMFWQSRKEVQFAHEAFHKVMFKNTPLTKKSVVIRFITPDVAIVHMTTAVDEFTTPGGTKMPANDDLSLMVYVKKAGKWLLTAGENVVVDEHAKQSNPVLHMPK